MEELHGKTLRRNYTKAEQKMFSRYKLIVKYMVEEKGMRQDHDQFLSEMNADFKHISSFEKILRSRSRERRVRLAATEEAPPVAEETPPVAGAVCI